MKRIALVASGIAVAAPLLIATPANADTPIVTVSYGGNTLPYLGGDTFYSQAQVNAMIPPYYENGLFDKEVDKIVTKTLKYGKAEVKKLTPAQRKKTAIVFDTDDTLLSNYQDELETGFNLIGGTGDAPMFLNATLPVIPQTKTVFDWAVKAKLKIYIITGRRPNQEAVTIQNLANVGIPAGSYKLHIRPDSSVGKPSTYKTAVRKKLEKKKKLNILINIGDQYSDLMGGYADRAFKLPNPMYFIP